ncbi:MAG: GvpL/GvpF family gas vesicle protein [Polyangia bacterium]
MPPAQPDPRPSPPESGLPASGLPASGLYVFGLVRAERAPEVATLGSFAGGEPIEALPLRGLLAVVCRVSLAEWSAAAGATNRAELGWLGPRAIRHQEILEQLMVTGAVLPLRFGRVFATAERLAAAIDREHAAIDAFLDEAAGREEWVLTGVLEVDAAGAAGRATARAAAHEEAAALARWLDGLACRRQILPVAPHATAGAGAAAEVAEVVVRWALLLTRAQLSALMQRLEELEGPLLELGLSLEARGPWPPFSFAPPLADLA